LIVTHKESAVQCDRKLLSVRFITDMKKNKFWKRNCLT